MSGPIRSAIGPQKSRLRKLLTDFPDVGIFFDPNLTDEQNVERLPKLRLQLECELIRIEKTVDTLIRKDTEWITLIQSLSPEERGHEERLYQERMDDPESYITVIFAAQDKMAQVQTQLNEIDRLVTETKNRILAKQQPVQTPFERPLAPTTPVTSIDTTTPPPIPQLITSAPIEQSLRLPKYELPRFDGNPAKWKSFIDTFTSAVDSKPISKVSKFAYLKMCLVGKAASAIAGIAETNENYDSAMQLLCQRFGKRELVVEALYTELRQLPRMGPRIEEIRNVVDQMEKILRQLEAQNENVNSQCIVHLLLPKLSIDVMKDINRYKKASESWSLEKLRVALSDVIENMEQIQRTTNPIYKSSYAVPNPNRYGNETQIQRQRRFGQQSTQNPRWSAASLAVQSAPVNRSKSQNFQNMRMIEPGKKFTSNPKITNNESGPRNPCIFCGDNHYNKNCNKYPTAQARKLRIQQLGKCYICLRDDHFSSSCLYANRPCFYCQAHGHHQTLCPKVFIQKTNRPENKQRPPIMKRTAVIAVTNSEDETTRETTIDNETKNKTVVVKDTTVTHVNSNSDQKQVTTMLMTAVAKVQGTTNPTVKQKCNILLDPGSDKTFVTQKLAKKLHLPIVDQEVIHIHTFANHSPKQIESNIVNIELDLIRGEPKELQANTVPIIVSRPRQNAISTIDIETIKKRNLGCLANPSIEWSTAFEPDILIGIDHFWSLLEESDTRIRLPSGLYAIPSKLGVLIGGSASTQSPTGGNKPTHVLCVQTDYVPHTHLPIMGATNFSTVQLGTSSIIDSIVTSSNSSMPSLLRQPTIEDFWKIESIGILDNPYVSDDDVALAQFNETVFFENGRYHVRWPRKPNAPPLPTNYQLAYRRLCSLVRRLHSENESYLRPLYQKIFEEQESEGIIEKVDENTETGDIQHYIPHQPVVQMQRETTKLRIVYDASAKMNKNCPSLNDCLYRGPVLLPDLCGLLLRFCLFPIAILADVAKAFLQVGLQVPDRDATRFLCPRDFENPSMDASNVQIYRFTRVCFGVISSPFLLAATIRYHLEKANTPLANLISKNIYVDNVILGTNSVAEAQAMYNEAKGLFQSAGMNLREWMSNSTDFVQAIPESDRANPKKAKIFGLPWNLEEDYLTIPGIYKINNNCKTKRDVLKSIATIFDPLGLLAPIVLLAKVFLQQMWLDKLEWDIEMSEELRNRWKSIAEQLQKLADFHIPRYIGCMIDEKTELHVFVDASLKAYACAVYFRHCMNGQIYSRLIFAKNRVAPQKRMTIPRLELLAMLLGVRAINFVVKQLPISICDCTLWSDSTCCLAWLTSDKPLSVFVTNRKTEILKSPWLKFRYILTTQNPADCATHGISATTLMDSQLWWEGPPFFKIPNKSEWPIFDQPKPDKKLIDYEESKSKSSKDSIITASVTKNNEIESKSVFPIDRCSSFTKLCRISIVILRFVALILNRLTDQTKTKYESIIKKFAPFRINGKINAKEMHVIEQHLIKVEQQRHFFEIFQLLEKAKSNDMMKKLRITKDENDILRCQGRMQYADLPDEAKTPILLPRSSWLTTLIVRDIHEQHGHVGVQHTLTLIRNKYWITKGRQVVNQYIRNCVECKKTGGGPFLLPSMPPLPPERVKKSKPFENVGLDYLGPIWIKDNNERVKSWVCLITCFITRAIHLEPVLNLSAEQFLNSFRRFISRRGKPDLVLSDNAPQFKLANQVLDKAWSETLQHDDVVAYCANRKINWRFTVAYAPWMGGIYERLVASVKSAFKKTVGRRLLSLEQLFTFLNEIEAILNTRPLTYVDQDINSYVLKPSDFLCLNGSLGTPTLDYDKNDPDYIPKIDTQDKLLRYLQTSQEQANTFWSIWSSEYLSLLREHERVGHQHPRVISERKPIINEIVLVKEENLPRGAWKLARIQTVHHGKDGQIRAASIRTTTGKCLTRPITMLYPLEIPVKEEQNQEKQSDKKERADEEQQKSQAKNAVPKHRYQTRLQSRKQLSTTTLTKLLTILSFILQLITHYGVNGHTPTHKPQLNDSIFRPEDIVAPIRKITSDHDTTHLTSKHPIEENKTVTTKIVTKLPIKSILKPEDTDKPVEKITIEDPRHFYNVLRRKNANASKCPSIVKRTAVDSPKCLKQSLVVYQLENKTYCWALKKCPHGHLNGKGKCGPFCRCPDWSIDCSHYDWKHLHKDKNLLFRYSKGNLKNILEFNKPNFCSLEPNSQCSPKATHAYVAKIELFNGTTYYVQDLKLKQTESIKSDFDCIGKGLIVSGSPRYCTYYNCSALGGATKFCYYKKPSLTYLVTKDGTVPIRAWGKVPIQFFGPKILEPEATNCTTCTIICTDLGVKIELENNIGAIEVCSKPFCYSIKFPKSIENVTLPTETKIVSSTIIVTIFSNGYLIQKLIENCPAVPFCSTIDCTFCYDVIYNPQCTTSLWWLLFIIILSVVFTIALIVYCCVILCRKCEIYCFKKNYKSNRYQRLKMEVESLQERAEPSIEDDSDSKDEEIILSSIRTRKPPRKKSTKQQILFNKFNNDVSNTLTSMSTISFIILIILLLNVMSVKTCSEITTLNTNQEDCHLKDDGTQECVINDVTRLALSPQGQQVCLLIKDKDGNPSGSISLEVKSIDFICQTTNEFFTRSFEMKTVTQKRCPNTGSCVNNKCADIKSDSKIPELLLGNDAPGETGCFASPGCWAEGCFYCTTSCTFYRTYASPTSDTTYEVISCVTWLFEIKVKMRLTTNKNVIERELTLIPGKVENIQNIRISLISIIQPPTPILNAQFLLDGQRALMIRGFNVGQPMVNTISQIQCANREAADKFKCELSNNICACKNQNDDVSCSCSSLSIEDLFRKSKHVLPLKTHGITLNYVKGQIKAEFSGIAAMEMQLALRGYRLINTITSNICHITSNKLYGCYSCINAATFSYRCTTNFGQALAYIKCNNIRFSLLCPHVGSTKLLIDRAKIKESCTVQCPGGTTNFILQGTLVFINKTRIDKISNIIGRSSMGSEMEVDTSFLGSWFSSNWLTAVILVILAIIVTIIFIVLLPTIITQLCRTLQVMNNYCKKANEKQVKTSNKSLIEL